MNIDTAGASRGTGAERLDPDTVHAKFVLAIFDAATVERVQALWEQLSRKGIRTPIDEGEAPHLSLGGVELLRADAFRDSVRSPGAIPSDSFRFSHVGAFGAGEFLWLGVTMTPSLERLHTRVHELLQQYSPEPPDSMYVPGAWIPHSTIARSVGPEQMRDFWTIVRGFDFSAPVTLSDIQLVDVSYPRPRT